LFRKPFRVPDEYVGVVPSDQNALDIFQGEWSSQLPASRKDLHAGKIPLFEDPRIRWAADQFGGVAAQRLLELGPLEAGHTYMLEKLGADRVTAVEMSKRAFLKCLIIKEVLGLKNCRFLLGDCVAFLSENREVFDACFASGVLYHMIQPSQLLYLLSKATKKLFLWTHFYDERIIQARRNLARKFAGSAEVSCNGFDHHLYKYVYGDARKWSGFCGGTAPYSYWMSRKDILDCLRFFGFEDLRIGFDEPNHPNGPSFCIAALRSP